LGSDSQRSLPIGWRLSLHVAGIGSILCLTVVFAMLPFQYTRVEREALTEARILAEAVSMMYQRLGNVEPKDDARKLLLRVARTPHIAMVNIHDSEGFVRYSTDSRELGKLYPIRLGVISEDNMITVSQGSASVVIDRDLMLADTHRLFAQVAIGLMAVIFILSFLIKGLIERLVSARLSRLMNLIENAEQGSFLIRAEVDRYDEIGHVIVGFNQLLGLITQIEARSLEREHHAINAEADREIRLKLEETLFQLESSNQRLNRKVQAQVLLMEAAHRLGGTLKRESIVERLIELVQEKLSWPQFMVFLRDTKNQDKAILRMVASLGISEQVISPNTKIDMGEGVAGLVAQTGAPLVVANLEKEKNLELWRIPNQTTSIHELSKTGSLMAVPIIHKGRVLGVFIFLHPQVNKFDSDDVALMSALGAQTALAIVNAELYETTLELATSDPLTGVMNRRAMVRQIEYELTRAQRFGTELALLLVDVDHFKAYNDRMGHVLGDVALKEIASALKNSIRKVDSLARFGGEEFCVILPQAGELAAREVAHKLCGAVRALKLRGVEKQELGHLSVSIGIKLIKNLPSVIDMENAMTDIISAADQGLYEAKRLGRDRYIVNQQQI